MPSIILTTGSNLDALLEALDTADRAVRDRYRKLADDPDLAPEHELRELHAARTELSRKVGMTALADWRAARSAVETPDADSTSATSAASTSEPALARETKGVVAPHN